MRFGEVVGALDVIESRGDVTVDVVDVVSDTRAVVPASVFCCVPGARVDGHDLAGDAVRAGAVALLCERLLDVDVAQASSVILGFL